MAQFIYTMNRVGKVVPPKRVILRDISLSFFPGAKIGVLGLNGAGKSTLLRIMAGIDKEFEGEARPQPGIKIGFLPQEPQARPRQRRARQRRRGGTATSRTRSRGLDAGLCRLRRTRRRLRQDRRRTGAARGAHPGDRRAQPGAHARGRGRRAAAAALGRRRQPKISGGERRRVALCQLLLSKPDMLLLDEPTNHLDAESVRWLEHFLEQYPGTVIAVTHDRYFLDNVAGWILELDRGHGIPWQGNYTSWLEQKEQRLQVEEQQQGALKRMLDARARVGARQPEGPPGQEQGAHAAIRGTAARANSRRATRPTRSTSRRVRGSASSWSKRRVCPRRMARSCCSRT